MGLNEICRFFHSSNGPLQMRLVVWMLMPMRMSTQCVMIRVSVFVRSINRVDMIVAMFRLFHDRGLKRFVGAATAAHS